MINKIYFLLILFIGISVPSFSQSDIFSTPNTYRTKENTYYWKNRTPYAGYWQQDVHYKIQAEILDSLNIIDCKSYELTYWNNSPFELKELFFHLHENSFTPGSHYHDLNENNDVKTKFGKYEEKGLGTTIENLQVNNKPVKIEMDYSIMKVFLNEPLKPGDSIKVTCAFKTYWDNGTMRRRNKFFETWGTKQFDGVHWYPIISVYDPKFGWTTDQHLDKEFYANFGTFDVALTFPQEYIVEATGNLINKPEVMPDSLRAKLDIKNFAKKPYNEAPSIIIPKVPGKKKTWIYHAENVHNFAFTADPTYRIGEREWKGVKIITLAQEPHASKWQESGYFTKEVIRIYSEDFGMYAWPKIIVADAKDGMEYPMLTLDNGTYPQHQGLLAHEVGHMWFYGMVGSNETYRASLDEGFTQFLTVWSMDKIVGEIRDRVGQNKYIDRFSDSSNTRYENLYYPYLNHVVEYYDEPLNTHSSGFNGALRHSGNYGLVYYKTGVMLYNLKYVLGDSLFLGAMKHYFNKWKFAHPYPEDFRQAIIEYTQTDLNWFFDQWMETTKFIDYGIEKVKRKRSNESNENYKYEITFRRSGRMQMPIDFTVKTKDNKSYNYLIPNTWFVKDSVNKKVLPKWYGWDLLHPTYKATIVLPSKIKTVDIDPSRSLADIDLTNNSYGGMGISTIQFDHRVGNITRWDKQRNYLRPDIWYNSVDGVQAGLHGEGNYFGKFSYSATVWGNTTLGHWDNVNITSDNSPVSYSLSGKAYTNKFWKQSSANYSLSSYGGISIVKLGYEKIFRKQDQRNPKFSKIFFFVKRLYNYETFDQYLLNPDMWGDGTRKAEMNNNYLNMGYYKNYFHNKLSGDVTINIRTPFINSDYNYSYINLNSINAINVSKFEVRSRMFGQMGYSQSFPRESALMLSGANSEDMLDNKYTRANGFVPTNWTGFGPNTNHFQMGGGLNLRGYSGYYAVQEYKHNGTDSTFQGYFSNTGASWNVEIDFDKFLKMKARKLTKNFKMDTYLFSDMGMLVFQKTKEDYIPGRFRMDAGLGSTLTIKFSPYQINPIVLRFDMPFFLSAPPAGEEYWQFRYVVGINRCF